jgi:hypothetical protein
MRLFLADIMASLRFFVNWRKTRDDFLIVAKNLSTGVLSLHIRFHYNSNLALYSLSRHFTFHTKEKNTLCSMLAKQIHGRKSRTT